MGELTALPNQFENLVRLGKVALNQRQWPEAIAHLEAAYDLQQTTALNLLLVSVLVAAGDNQRALQLALEKKDFYTNETDLRLLYNGLLIKNQHFIAANELWSAVEATDAFEQRTKQKGQALLKTAEKAYQATEQQAIKKRQEQLYNITTGDFQDQQRRLDAAELLPLADYLQGVSPILVNPYCHPFVKTTILETLVRLRYSESVTINWFDQVQQVTPSELELMTNRPVLKLIQKTIQNILGQQDPIILEAALAECQMTFAYLYPFEETVIDNPEEWGQALIQQLGVFIFEPTVPISEKTIQWLKKLQELTEELVF
ncbi:hypothetical protein [Latilactobacillus sakei]|uniref:hypothetical protein n=1 Tax=Latilactobacillus sakei TaxID=1599 RepID=UPI001389E634|nr:hypothetical protein [Latilactobacillus sakei]